MKQIGVFIGFGPTIDIRTEGIGRLLAILFEGAVESNDIAMTVVVPHWFRHRLRRLLQDQQLDAAKLEILTTGRIPLSIRLLQLYNVAHALLVRKQLRSWRKRHRRLQTVGELLRRWTRALVIKAKHLFLRLLASSSPLAWLIALPLMLACGGIAVFALPMMAIALLQRRLGRMLGPRLSFFGHALSPARSWLRRRLVPEISAFVEVRERQRMVRIANLRSEIPVWFIPTPFWPEVKGLNARKVMAAPDIVYADFPNYFTHEYNVRTYARIMHAAASADRLICYSRYVAEQHLGRYAGVDSTRITVINHGAVRLDKYLSTREHGAVLRRQKAARILQRYQAERLISGYWASVCFTELPFVFYSSQYRPYKNFRNLIEALARLVHQDGVNVRLVTTATIDAVQTPDLQDLIHRLHMEKFVFCAPDLPSVTLAAFNHLAVCAVNPTLFEGGFPFTFSEAYSVGTPSVMSRIPVVMERMPSAELADLMLFDPQDVGDMADRIRYGLENREKLFELQRPLYQEHKEWNVVAQRYIAELLELPTPAPEIGRMKESLPGRDDDGHKSSSLLQVEPIQHCGD